VTEKIDLPVVLQPVVGVQHRTLEALLSDIEQGSSITSGENGGLVGLTSRLPAGQGLGSWKYVKLTKNLILSLTNARYAHNVRINIEGDDTFKVRVVLRGRLRTESDERPLSAPFVYVESYPGHSADSYEILAGRINMIVLHCRAEELSDGMGLAGFPVPLPISELFSGSQATTPLGDAVRVGAEVMRAASDMFAAFHQYPEELLPAFLTAKAREILCSVLRQLSAPSLEAAGTGLRSRDVNRIYEARDIILSNLQKPLTLAELSRSVGICQTKLKVGFKAIFGTTVFEYVRARQMERALELLLNTDKNISEVAYEVGYMYPANFTHAFRKQLGYLPTEARRHAQEPH